MHDVFSLPHVFVVFHQGSGGNFVAGLINKILNGDTTIPSIASDGSSHTVIPSPISFGLTTDERLLYTDEERERVYLERIRRLTIDKPIVSWSHDFSNIELYKKHFKNSKILCITTDTVDEILTCTFMNIYKMLLQVPYDWPTHKSIQEFRTRRLDVSTVALLKELIKPEYQEYASTIYKYRDTEPYKSIINFTLMRLLLTSYGIQVTDTHVNSDICTFNYITCPLKNRSDYHIVSDHIHTYTSSADVVIPYDTIRFGNNELLIDSIAKLINKPLLETESSLVHDAVKKYTSSQSITMLRNPKQYYLDIKKSCSLFMK